MAEQYEAMSYRELQAAAKALGVKASGKRDELLARLLEEQQANAGIASKDSTTAAPAEAPEEEQQPQPQPQQEEAEEAAAVSVPSPEQQQQPPEPSPPKRKAEAEAIGAPSLKHLKSPVPAGVVPARRPLPASGIKPPTIFAAKGSAAAAAASPALKPASRPAPASAGPAATRKSVAPALSGRASILSSSASKAFAVGGKKLPVASGPSPFGPGTYGAGRPSSAAASSSSSAAAAAAIVPPVVLAPTASAKAALLKERPKLNYKPHTGPLRPFFSPKPFLVQQHQQQGPLAQQPALQRKPLGFKGNMAMATTKFKKASVGPVVAKSPASAAAAKHL